MRKTLAVLASIFVAMLISNCSKSPELEAWNIYKGQLLDYRVEIEETKQNGVWTRIIDLESFVSHGDSVSYPFAITGHDNDGDGQLDRIFICRLPVNGYNSVIFTGKGKRMWEPCPADKDKVNPFTDAEVDSAQAQLYLAMATVHNKGHLVSTLESYRAKQLGQSLSK